MNKSEKEIIEGWERVAMDYVPRELTITEKHQVEMAALIEKQSQEKKFTLG